MKNFNQTKKFIIEYATKENACSSELNNVNKAKTKDELLVIIKNNLSWVSNHKLFNGISILEYFTQDKLIEFGIGNLGADNTGFSNSGYRNSGNWNSGDRNSGDRNSGYRNSGYRNSGNWNSGNWNSGDSNSGYRNSGNWNSGYRNSGNWNSGDSNSGDRNSGYRNSGYRNSGNWNSGNWNSGYRNSGNWNSGYSNSGDRNSGYRNSGNWNSGDRNSGDSNSGYRNDGAFCTETNPKIRLFDKETNILVRDWEQSRACLIMGNLNPNIWIWSNEMTEDEKKKFPTHEVTGGYLKTIPYKEAWLNLWGNLSDKDKQEFKNLENFDSNKFEEITGIKV